MDAIDSGSPEPGDYKRMATDPTLPSGITASAARGKADLAPLMADHVRTELTVRVGKDFLSCLSEPLRSICASPDDWAFDWEGEGDRQASVLRYKIARALLRRILSVSAFWYPLAAYVGTIVTRQGIARFGDNPPRGPDRPLFTIIRIE